MFDLYILFLFFFQSVGDTVSLSTERSGQLVYNTGGHREGYFTNISLVELPTTISLEGYTSFSLRTCSYGKLLHQVDQNLFLL